MKGLIFIFSALFIDLLQAGISLALSFALTAAAGALQFIPGIGTITGAALFPMGILLGFVVDICFSVTLGTGLIALLALNGMFYPKYIFGGGITELIPVLDNLPGWTAMTILCLLRKRTEEKEGAAESQETGGGRASLLPPAGAAAIPAAPGRAARPMMPPAIAPQPARAETETARAKADLKNIDGIRSRSAVAGAALALSLFCIGGGTVYAQSLSGAPDPVQYTIAPETPGPNQKVYIQTEGVGSFLGNSTITWQENGKTIASGVGLTDFSFTAGAIGSVTRVHVIIDSTTQGTLTHDFTFYPSSIDLVWEADTSVPPFYQGKPLYSAGSRLRVVAYPIVASGGVLLPASSLSFQWQRGGKAVPGQSGLGRNVFTFDGDQIQSAEDVQVDVFYGSTKVGHAEVSIPAQDPEIVLYDDDPLRGEQLDQALPGSITLTGKEITLKAEPYFFSNQSKSAGKLQFSWTLNGKTTTGPDAAAGILTLRQTGDGAGAAAVTVTVQNTETNKLVQSADAALRVIFGQPAGSSISSFFGL